MTRNVFICDDQTGEILNIIVLDSESVYQPPSGLKIVEIGLHVSAEIGDSIVGGELVKQEE